MPTRNGSRLLISFALTALVAACGCHLQGRTPFWPCDRAPRCVACDPQPGVCQVPGTFSEVTATDVPPPARRSLNPRSAGETPPRHNDLATNMQEWLGLKRRDQNAGGTPGRMRLDDDAGVLAEPAGRATVANPVTLEALESASQEDEKPESEQSVDRAASPGGAQEVAWWDAKRSRRATPGKRNVPAAGKAALESPGAARVEPWPYQGLDLQGQPKRSADTPAPAAYPNSPAAATPEDVSEAGWNDMPQGREPWPEEKRGDGKLEGLFGLPAIQPGPVARPTGPRSPSK